MDSRRKYLWLRSFAQWIVILAWTLLPSVRAQTGAGISQFRQQFANPPDNCRIMMRWWWFGPAVTKAELKLELQQMKEDGIGGVAAGSPEEVAAHSVVAFGVADDGFDRRAPAQVAFDGVGDAALLA